MPLLRCPKASNRRWRSSGLAALRMTVSRLVLLDGCQRVLHVLGRIEVRIGVQDGPIRRDHVRRAIRELRMRWKHRVVRLHDVLVGVGRDGELAAALAYREALELLER